MGRALLTVVAAVLYAIGYSAAMVPISIAWGMAAVALGWRDAMAATRTSRARSAAA